MKKLVATLAAIASLGFVVSCSDEVLEVNLNKDSETVEKTTTRTGVVTGVYEETLYTVVRQNTQPVKFVWNGSSTTSVDDETYVQEIIDGVSYWVRKVEKTTNFTADAATIKWTEKYAEFAGSTPDSTYKDYYNEKDTDSLTYTIALDNIEYEMPTVKFGGFKMTKKYKAKDSTFDADGVSAEKAKANYLKKGDVVIHDNLKPFKISRVGDTYYYTNDKTEDAKSTGDDEFKKVTFEGDLEDGNFENLTLVRNFEKDAENANDAIVKAAAWTNTYKLTITKFERYE